MEITVYDLCNLYIDDSSTVRVWCAYDAEMGGDGIVFDDTVNELTFRSDWSSCIVDSFGIEEGVLVINVS